MSVGAVLIAHNNGQTDYYRLACICAKKIKKHLDIPVTLLTDTNTLSGKNFDETFDSVVEINSQMDNQRKLFSQLQGFYNDTRCQAYDHTPYDTTLLVDVDYIINSDVLKQFLQADQSFMMAEGIVNFGNSEDALISPKSIKMKWATTIIFKKDKIAKAVFDQVKHIRNNYNFYVDMYGINSNNFRNDIAFSIAEHIVYGLRSPEVSLPKILFLTDKDAVLDIVGNNITVRHQKSVFDFCDMDYHVMDKSVITRLEAEILA